MSTITLPGTDDHGAQYGSVNEMWSVELREKNSSGKPLWYQKGIDYWANVPATVDGVLGGFGKVSSADCAASKQFLDQVFTVPLASARAGERTIVALDCGAGVGRISEEFLLNEFNEVDLVEPVKHFLDEARVRLLAPKDSEHLKSHFGRAAGFFCEPLETFAPGNERYDVIWIQWCIGHLTDEDFIHFFSRCAAGLKPDGIVVVKENNCKEGFIVDKDDSSVTRSDVYFRDLFQRSGFQIISVQVQRGFPKELFAVRMYALRPKAT
mmetsp:Transcript_13417/g.18341  ORF Transcript_13417/g.18341 Transcript_13417/m.18341 type:complete len:267 (+) Transcript_13417:163-963(+)|eukprot:CAMPEP_0196595134 /NCGR_PEP_ID=MMETSP1081-20130531/80278_1 /TAXON_ID=36882 /ORGANISM="Pyramimonas amylifera, Strain CCMP720" /LENGTH=266 /DNA_ID=CAMNT_0041919607 /DNA_START=37 /DNA_END=837 /DNA_ORIENTATION=-